MLVAVVMSLPAGADPAHAATVGFRDGLVTIQAADEPLEPILRELSRRSGVIVHLHAPPEQKVTASFEQLSFERAFDRLFRRDANVVFVYPNGRPGGLPSEVWVFGAAPRIADDDSDAGPSETTPAAAASEEAPGPQHDIANGFEGDPWAAWQSARWHPDPKVQRSAIAHLGEEATPVALEALLGLLEDRQSWVRQSALEALGPLVQRHARVRDAIIAIMERSVDEATRQLLADSISAFQDEEDNAAERGVVSGDASDRSHQGRP
ncbi:MAG TPA: HEAT repeat domain-containing protein [Methylomirabilota bacterium]